MNRQSDANIITSAEKQVTLAKNGKRFDEAPIKTCIGKFKNISQNGASLKGHYPALIEAIDEAILVFYPHEGHWDDGHRSELLDRYVSIMGRILIRDENPVGVEDYDRVLGLCGAIRKGFEKFHRAHVVRIRR